MVATSKKKVSKTKIGDKIMKPIMLILILGVITKDWINDYGFQPEDEVCLDIGPKCDPIDTQKKDEVKTYSFCKSACIKWRDKPIDEIKIEECKELLQERIK